MKTSLKLLAATIPLVLIFLLTNLQAKDILVGQIRDFHLQKQGGQTKIKLFFWDRDEVEINLSSNSNQQEILDLIKSSKDDGRILSIETNDGSDLQKINTKDSDTLGFFPIDENAAGDIKQCSQDEMVDLLRGFPSSKNSLSRVLGGLRSTQCYRRCHVWAKLMEQKNVISGKIFIFYAREKYKKIHNSHKWWFHVATYLKNESGEVRVVDDTFYPDRPVTIKEWVDELAPDIGECRVIQNYKIYEQELESRDPNKPLCYIMKVPRFYFFPCDIEDANCNGKFKESWDKSELLQSLKEYKKLSKEDLGI